MQRKPLWESYIPNTTVKLGNIAFFQELRYQKGKTVRIEI